MSALQMRATTPHAVTHAGWWLWLVCLASAACAGAATGGPDSTSAELDRDDLEQRAGRLLVEALTDRADESAALNELRMAAAAGVPWARVALASPSTQNMARDTRTALILVLAERGDDDAITALRQATARDTTTLTARLPLIDEDTFSAELPEALRHASASVRTAALQRLRRQASTTPPLVLEVKALARLDPSAGVRASAIEVLAAHRHLSIAELEGHLTDRDGSVRALAMRELARMDCARAQSLLADRLSAAPSQDGLAAIRALVPCGTPVLAATLDALRRTLLVPDNALRAEAAMTATAFEWRRVPDWFAQAIEHESSPSVVLALAIALQPTQPEMARATLHRLAAEQHPVVSVQAAALLADIEDANALSILRAARHHRDPTTRRTAFRALGRLGHVDDLEPGLRDPDVKVRLAAAGAVLRATS